MKYGLASLDGTAGLHDYALTNSLFSLGSYSTMYPATALAATVKGEARYI
jgi:hypothetical protein